MEEIKHKFYVLRTQEDTLSYTLLSKKPGVKNQKNYLISLTIIELRSNVGDGTK